MTILSPEDLARLDPEAAEAIANGRDPNQGVVDDFLADEDREDAERRGLLARGRGLQVSSLEFGDAGDDSEIPIVAHPVAVFRDTPGGIAVTWAGGRPDHELWGNIWAESRMQRRPLDVELVRRVYSLSTATGLDWVDD